jgi:AcrR family transcriptional regulator
MSIPYTESGRTSQKSRTREALLDSARALMADGITPTVEQAAAAASIGRATAYRYFPNQRALITATFPALSEPSLLGADPPAEPQARLEIVIDAITRQALEYEHQLRNMLRLSLEPEREKRDDLPFRTGRRIVWITDALEPLRGRMPDRDLKRLVHATAAAVGIDSLVWLTDIAGLSRKQAVETMRWSALALLRAAMEPLPTPA